MSVLDHHYVRLTVMCLLVGGAVLALQDSTRESIVLMLNPSAEQAYAYGSSHFDAVHPERYDLERAEALYRRALELDPNVPNAYHQLARIEFLRGNFKEAHVLIDAEISRSTGPGTPSAYYIRALIRGFDGNYKGAIDDYRTYLSFDRTNWAATNDLAWVLLKDAQYEATIDAIDMVLSAWPENPWLLNSKAIALYELGRYEEALTAIMAAEVHLDKVTEAMWSSAYPGNDPLIAHEGLATFRTAVRENMHRITLAYQKGYKSVQ